MRNSIFARLFAGKTKERRVEVVQNITGLDSERARRLLRATETDDWSRVPDEDLKLREIDEEEKLNRFRDLHRSFERMIVGAICIERGKREPSLDKAIMTAADRSALKLMHFGGIELDKKGNFKEEDLPRYFGLFDELVYFYMHMTLRIAHGQGFSQTEISKLQQEVFTVIIWTMVEAPFGHWLEEVKAKIKADHYQNMNSAEFEYGSCKEIYPTDDPLTMGNSVYATLARNIEERLGKSHNPEISFQIILEVSEQLCAQPFPKLLASVRESLNRK
jgi:hypothetical protein